MNTPTPATRRLEVSWVPRSRQGALVRLAFGVRSREPAPASAASLSKHLAFLPASALELDLSDPAQRAFGDYELVEMLGQGGMGVVYRARQASLDREVAVKLLSAGPWASADFIERFRREAQSAARLQHPNIVAVHEIGQQDALNFFSMALVRGPSLAQVLQQRGTLPPREAAVLLRPVTEALDYAHRLGVLHLDLKPGNVLLDEHGEPKVADFGLARRLDESLTTELDEVSGTPSYMAPEQAQLHRHKLSAATDIYGLGAILYECLTGRPPFVAATPQDVLQLVVTREPIRPCEFAHVPQDLEAICLKCLAKEPQQRYASARALGEDLARFLEGRQVSVRPLNLIQRTMRWARREPRVAVTAALALLALIAGLAATTSQWQRAENSASIARETAWRARRAEAWRLAEQGDPVSGLRGILANLREQQAAGASRGTRFDLAYVATTLDAAPQLIDVIALGAPIRAVAVSHDGKQVAAATAQAGALYGFDVASGRELWRTVMTDATPPRAVNWLAYSEDDRYLIAETFERERDPRTHRIDAARGLVLAPSELHAPGRRVHYSGDGRRAIVREADGRAQAWRLEPLEALGPPIEADPHALAWNLSRDGALAVEILPNGARLRDGRTLAVRASIPYQSVRSLRHVLLSPDARWLVIQSDPRGESEVYDTATAQRVARIETNGPAATFSEDGNWMALSQGRGYALRETATGRVVVFDYMSQFKVGMEDALLSRRHGWLIVNDGNEYLSAVRIGTAPFYGGLAAHQPRLAHQGEIRRSAIAAHFDSAVLASGGLEGELRLWRLPRDPAMGIATPVQAFEQFEFDGNHLPDVRDTIVVVRDVKSAEPRSPELAHAQPVQAAQVAPDGRTLVSAAGRQLYVWDWRVGALRYAPIELPATSVRLAMDRNARYVLASVGAARADGYHEVFRHYALADGGLRAEHALPGAWRRVEVSGDGRVALVWRDDAIERLDALSLAPLGPGLAFAPPIRVTGAAIDAHGTRVFAALALADRQEYRWYDATSGRELGRKATSLEARGIAVAPDGRTLAAQSSSRVSELVAIDGRFESRRFTPSTHEALPPVRFSLDGELIARAGFSGNLVTDARDDHPVTPLLYWGRADYNRFPSQLAWSADGDRLAVQMSHGGYAHYDLRPWTASLDELATLVELTQAEKYSERWPSPPQPDATRAVLRRYDRGPPNPWEQRSTHWSDRPPQAIPARAPGLPAELVDLGVHYTRPLWPYSDHAFGPVPLHMLPVGRQRFDGIDYDVRGVVLLVASSDSIGGDPPAPHRVEGIAVGLTRIAAVTALCTLMGAPATRGQPVAQLRFEYRDGSRARAALIHGDHVLHARPQWEGLPSAASSAHLVWTAWPDWSENPNVNRLWRLYAARLPNPHPEREVASLALEAVDAPNSVLAIFALTLEPAAH